jgi:hypothetical protein
VIQGCYSTFHGLVRVYTLVPLVGVDGNEDGSHTCVHLVSKVATADPGRDTRWESEMQRSSRGRETREAKERHKRGMEA